MKPILSALIAIMSICPSMLQAVDSEPERRFEQSQCKLVLPAGKYQWLDHTKISDSTAVFGDDSGLILNLVIKKAQESEQLDKYFIKRFDADFLERAKSTKISGEIIKFRSVPCYQLHVRSNVYNSIETTRTFFANGYHYQLQIIGSKLPIEERDKLDNIFNAFEFTTTPTLAETTDKESFAFKFGQKMGYIFGICILGIVILVVVKLILRIGNKVS